MKNNKYIKDCEIPFRLEWWQKYGSCLSCGIELSDGKKLSYLPLPCGVRNAQTSITRYLKSAEGQTMIKNNLN